MEAKTTHTPGPWVARYDDRVSLPNDVDGTKSIAHVYGWPGQPYAQSANQALIAAAPELYEALKKAAETFRVYERLHLAKDTPEGIEKARANAATAEMCEAALSRVEQTGKRDEVGND